MTLSLAISVPNLCLVASDTRISLQVPGYGTVINDGPTDFRIQTNAIDVVVPIRMRKLARIGNGWAAMAGDFLTGRQALHRLANLGVLEPIPAYAELQRNYATISSDARASGFTEATIRDTAVLLAPYGPGYNSSAFLLGALPSPMRGVFQVAFPPGMQEQGEARSQHLESCLRGNHSIFDIIREVCRIFDEASKTCSTCSAVVQIGITAARATGPSASYITADSEMLARSSDAFISDLREKLPRSNF